MHLRFIHCAAVAAGTVLGAGIALPTACAVDAYFDGQVSNDYNVDANWGPFNFRPEGAAGINERAVIGYDNPLALLSPNVTLAATPPNPGGLVLGVRQRNTSGAFVNAPPAPGALTGSLTMSSGTLTNVVGTGSGIDGRVLVGVDGRGYLTMTGGTLNALGLVVGGEQVTAGNGTSLVDLSGSATVNITGSTGLAGLATFGRRLKVTGPNVNFNATRNIRLEGTNSYTAMITSATAHSPLKTGANVIYGGAINVQFSGAGATHALGQTWNLFDAALNVTGSFNNLSPSGDVPISGLTATPPVGAVYRLKQAPGAGTRKLLQLVYDRVLVLRVNRDTGELSITNPLGATVSIDSYSVASPLGSLVTTYKGISGAPAGAPNWQKYGLTANALTEVINDPTNSNTTLNLTGVPSLTLGNGFNKLAVGGSTANFGLDGEDLTFQYSTVDGTPTFGVVEYVGTKFENNLVLRVNPTSGQAFLKNDSLVSVTIDGYSIKSATNALVGGTWTGIGGAWEKSQPPSAGALSETNPIGATTIAPGASLAIGDIGAFPAAADQAGLSMEFILAVGFTGGPAGDFDADSDVDGNDFLTWQRGVGGAFDAADLVDWRTNYGAVGGGPPETTFRVGSVVFDATAGVAASGQVPEPRTAGLLLAVAGAALAVGRRGARRGAILQAREIGAVTGDSAMSTRSTRIWTAQACGLAAAAILASAPAAAATQGIPLTNSRMELPGPTGSKRIAFNPDGSPNNAIPGWTFPGPGVETFGHDGMNGTQLIMGDSGTEGGGNPGNEILLSTFDGLVFQTSSFNVVNVPSTQKYRLSFDAHEIFTIDATGAGFPSSQCQLTVRLYYLAGDNTTRTTIGTPLVLSALPGGWMNYSIEFVGGAAALTPALGRPIGVEFDTTSKEFNPLVAHSWAGVDNVLLQIAGVTDGDLDGDGDVDIVDYRVIRDNLAEAHDFLAEGDLNGDGQVNLNDFRVWKSLPPVVASGVLAQLAIPEPSTVALAAIGGAGLARTAGRRRRAASRPNTARSARVTPRCGVALAVAAVALAATWAPTATATLLAYDPFLIGNNPAAGEYTVGLLDPTAGVGDGQNPSIGIPPTPATFFDGGWHRRTSGDAPNVSVRAEGLSYIGAPALGGSLFVNREGVTGDTNGRIGRNLAAPWDSSTTGTYFISFLTNFGAMPANNLNGDMGYRTVEFRTPAGMPDLIESSATGYIGYNAYYHPNDPTQRVPATARMTFQFGGQYLQIENAPQSFHQDGATHLVVLKFVLTTTPVVDGVGGDTISVYLDPLNTTEPALPGATVTGVDFSLGVISGATMYGSDGSVGPAMDELRIGTTYVDVLPDFPLPGDTNGDDLVDLVDYNNIVSHMNQSVTTALEGDVAKADGTQGSDGRVTIADYRIWRDHRTDVPLADPAGVGVPEPTSMLMVVVALGGWRGLRKRAR